MRKSAVGLSMTALLLLISITAGVMKTNEAGVSNTSCAVETNKYVGALLEYQNNMDRCHCVLSKKEVDFFNALVLQDTGEFCAASDDWIFRVTATTKMIYSDSGVIDIDNMIPADAETLVICVYDNAIIVGEKKYLLESSIIGILEDKFITDKLHQ